MKCKKCGNELKETAKFCDECGEKIEVIQENIAVETQIDNIVQEDIIESQQDIPTDAGLESPHEHTAKYSAYIILGIVCIVFILIVMAMCNPFTDDNYNSSDNASDNLIEETKSELDLSLQNDTTSESSFVSEYESKYDFYADSIEVLKDDMELTNEEADKVFGTLLEVGLDEKIKYCFDTVDNESEYFEVWWGLTRIDVYLKDSAVDKILDDDQVLYQNGKVVQPTTEEPTEPPTEKPTSVTDTMTKLYEDSEIAVYYKSIEKSYGRYTDVNLMFENKMNKSIKIQADTVILDGITYNNVICSDPISANSKGMIEISVKDCDNTSPSTFGADLKYFDKDTYDNVIHLNIVSHSLK